MYSKMFLSCTSQAFLNELFVEKINYDDPTDPNNKEIIDAIGVTATKLDTVIKDIVYKENNLRV